MKKVHLLFIGVVALWLLLMAPSPSAADKGEREAIEKLTSEVLILQRQVRDMQESIDRNNGQLITLAGQIGDKVALASQAIQDVQVRMQDTQTRVSTALGTIDTRLLTLDANFRTVNERLAQTLDQLAVVTQGLAALKAQSAASIDLTDPVQVFGAAYADYLKGNYQLSIDQFRQFLSKVPQSEQADDALYWIGEAYFNQGQYDQAITEYDHLLTAYPQADKVPAARLKKGLALLALNQTDKGVEELRLLLKDFPDSAAATAAKQRLEELGVPTTEPPKPSRGRRVHKASLRSINDSTQS